MELTYGDPVEFLFFPSIDIRPRSISYNLAIARDRARSLPVSR